MIVSHRYRFIFVKTRKTAGTSLEVFLSALCGDDDILTPVDPAEPGHRPRNHAGRFDPRPELRQGYGLTGTMQDLLRGQRFWNHMQAGRIRARVPRDVWRDYLTFTIERNPWDKTVSHYHSVRARRGGTLGWEAYLAGDDLCFNYPIYTVPRDPRRVMVDRVLRYESLDRELTEVLGSLGVPFTGSLGIGAKGSFRTDRRPFQEAFTPQQRDFIERAFRPEIELHGYTFDEPGRLQPGRTTGRPG